MRIDLELDPCDAALQLLEERAHFDSLTVDTSRLRVWQPRRALIATAAEARLPTFAAAVERARDRGLDVHFRHSGGGSVCLGPGTLVVTQLYVAATNDIDASYRDFSHGLLAAATDLGIPLAVGEVGQAYCNGKFDIAWRGLKVGGIAQRRRLRQGMSLVWIHAVVAVEPESLRCPEAVAAFYSDLRSPRIADPRSTTCLSECLPPHAPPQGLLKRCGDAIVRAFEAPTRAASYLESRVRGP